MTIVLQFVNYLAKSMVLEDRKHRTPKIFSFMLYAMVPFSSVLWSISRTNSKTVA